MPAGLHVQDLSKKAIHTQSRLNSVLSCISDLKSICHSAFDLCCRQGLGYCPCISVAYHDLAAGYFQKFLDIISSLCNLLSKLQSCNSRVYLRTTDKPHLVCNIPKFAIIEGESSCKLHANSKTLTRKASGILPRNVPGAT